MEPTTESELTSQLFSRTQPRPLPSKPREATAGETCRLCPGRRSWAETGFPEVRPGPVYPELHGADIFRFRQTWKVILRVESPNKAVVSHSGPEPKVWFPFHSELVVLHLFY